MEPNQSSIKKLSKKTDIKIRIRLFKRMIQKMGSSFSFFIRLSLSVGMAAIILFVGSNLSFEAQNSNYKQLISNRYQHEKLSAERGGQKVAKKISRPKDTRKSAGSFALRQLALKASS